MIEFSRWGATPSRGHERLVRSPCPETHQRSPRAYQDCLSVMSCIVAGIGTSCGSTTSTG